MAEGGALLRRYTAYTRIEGSNPSLSAKLKRTPCGSVLIWRSAEDEKPRGSTSEHRSRRTRAPSGDGGPEQSEGFGCSKTES